MHLHRLLAGTATILAAGTAIAGTGHQWGDFRWAPGGVPVTLDLSFQGGDTADIWRPYYKGSSVAAFEKWGENAQSPLTLNSTELPADDAAANACDPILGEVIVRADTYGSTGWVGVATIDADAEAFISWATAQINDSYFTPGSFYDTPAQREFVMCHEIGHTFGLGHLDTNFYNRNLGTCMDYSADPDGGGRYRSSNLDPGQADWNVLNSATMYGEGADDGGSGNPGRGGGKGRNKLGAFPPAQAELPGGRFGGIVGYDAEGRPNHYVRDLANGHRRVTYVLWARGYRPEGSRLR
ncbi:hypothetical protein [Sphingomicrobium astaxanthinifaciens]|uniref:hypothetical protein n=1 Tax=Sphingomicrobium astaxanthinifaciens TaxID=1227949 RepID=UPI001FCB81F8|nr:hypothetical protein [Sphingomicrobium astaxanthinifaciens]MCJ7421578.1 hypothetical protein [Sphingomicrobium astaxanthinifaciens]